MISVLNHCVITREIDLTSSNCIKYDRAVSKRVSDDRDPLGAFTGREQDRRPSLKGKRLIPGLSLEDEGSEKCALASLTCNVVKLGE